MVDAEGRVRAGHRPVLATGALIAGYFLILGATFQVSVLLGMGLALSSTAFVLQLLGERGDMAAPAAPPFRAAAAGPAIVPLLALVPILAGHAEGGRKRARGQRLAVAGAIAAVVLLGRHAVPFLLGWMARRRNMEAFAMVAALAVFGAAGDEGGGGVDGAGRLPGRHAAVGLRVPPPG